MSNTAVMGVCTVALVCIEYAADRGLLPFAFGVVGAAIAFWLLGKAIKRKIEGKP